MVEAEQPGTRAEHTPTQIDVSESSPPELPDGCSSRRSLARFLLRPNKPPAPILAMPALSTPKTKDDSPNIALWYAAGERADVRGVRRSPRGKLQAQVGWSCGRLRNSDWLSGAARQSSHLRRGGRPSPSWLRQERKRRVCRSVRRRVGTCADQRQRTRTRSGFDKSVGDYNMYRPWPCAPILDRRTQIPPGPPPL